MNIAAGSIKLIDLQPRWSARSGWQQLSILCPQCRTHRMLIPIGPVRVHAALGVPALRADVWKMYGSSLDDLTLDPLIEAECCKVRIERGQVTITTVAV